MTRVSYRFIFENYLDCDKSVEQLLSLVSSLYSNLTNNDLDLFKSFLEKTFIKTFKQKWKESCRNKPRFLISHENWLSTVYCFGADFEHPVSSPKVGRGRPVKTFEHSCPRTKKKKIYEFCSTHSVELIKSAAHKLNEPETQAKISVEKALSLILDASLSKHQYEVLRNTTREGGFDIFPEYHQIIFCKKRCYPVNLKIEENYAKVDLQDLLDHTVKRILETKSENELAAIPNELKLVSKWGCDGSSGHSEYHQSFSDENYSDKNMFLTSLVPLTLTENGDESYLCWKNMEPSSTRLCRPLKFEFVKETSNVINTEVNRVNNEIANLTKSVVEIKNKKFEVTHELALTMIDGKVASTISETSSMCVCYICGAKPTEMSNLELLKSKLESDEAVKFGISPLHARIKFMECILHIAYKKDFAKWKSNKETKQQIDATKADIKKRLKATLGINVDVVKQGMGTTNNGNTSRRFFENPSITADILGVNVNLIHRFKIILTTINSHALIDAEKFGNYCMDTAKLYTELYGWYYMPITVHKVLIHGKKIISEAILPIGMLSEEAQEARNKDYRNYRLSHSRKFGRMYTNEDVLHHLLISSDPFINKFRVKIRKNKMEHHDDVKSLLVE